MHLNILKEIEWDAAGELGYVMQAAQNMRILYFSALVIYSHILIYNVTDSREHFHFCIKVHPDSLC